VTAGGWLLLGVSWLSITSLAVYCLYRTLRAGDLIRDHDEP
jgi:hypothetical protein